MSASKGFEGVQEGGSGVVVVEVWESVITTEGEEVEVAFGLVSLQAAGHGLSLRGRPHRTM